MFKYVRLGDWAGTKVYMQFLGSAVAMVAGNVLRGRRPTGANYLLAFLSGTFASYRFAIDRRTRQYVPKK
jgi:hypothetical protein